MRHFSNMSYSAIKATAKLQNILEFLAALMQLLTIFCHSGSDCYGYSLTKFPCIAMCPQCFKQKIYWNQLGGVVIFQNQRSLKSEIIRAHIFACHWAFVPARNFLVRAFFAKLFKPVHHTFTTFISLSSPL